MVQSVEFAALAVGWLLLHRLAGQELPQTVLTLGLAWSAVIGAEYVGVESGIGRMIIWAEFFSHTGRMVLVTIFIVLYSTLSWIVMRSIAMRILAWMPKAHGQITPLN